MNGGQGVVTVPPAFVAVQTWTGSTGALSVAWPSHAAGDIGLLLVNTSNQTVATPSGWNAVTNGAQGVGAAGGGTAVGLQCFWRRATSVAEANADVADSGNHTNGTILSVRGCVASGDPINISAGDATSDADTTGVSIPGATTTIAQCFVVAITCHSQGNACSQSGETNASLSGLTERLDAVVSLGFGGGIKIVTGNKVDAGAYSATTATLSGARRQAHVSLALTPA